MTDEHRPHPSAADLAFIRAFVAEQAKFQNSISRRMLDTADSYLAAASVLGGFMDQTKDSKPAMGVALCQSLALEIYFKALVALHHDDASLYSHLPAEFRRGMREHELPKLVGLMAPPVQSTLVRMFGIVSANPRISLEEFMQLLDEPAEDPKRSWCQSLFGMRTTVTRLLLIPSNAARFALAVASRASDSCRHRRPRRRSGAIR